VSTVLVTSGTGLLGRAVVAGLAAGTQTFAAFLAERSPERVDSRSGS
jgi:hypothetical protein